MDANESDLLKPVHQRGLMMSASLVFSGGCIIPFMAPAMVANVGLTESQLPWIYLAGGVVTFITTPFVGRLSDRYDKLHVLGWLSLAAAGVVLVLTNLGPSPLWAAMTITAAFMVVMSGRFAPATTMVTNAVESRYRGGFMSVNSSVQQAASGAANVVAGAFVTTSPQGHLVGFPKLGFLSVACFGLTVFLAARVRAAAPHAARARPLTPAVAVSAE